MSDGALASFRRWLARAIAPVDAPNEVPLLGPAVTISPERAAKINAVPRDAHEGASGDLKQELRREKKRAEAALREQKRLEERVQTLSAELAKPRAPDPLKTIVAPIQKQHAKQDKQREKDRQREEKQKAREALIDKLQAKVTALEVNGRVLREELDAAKKKLADAESKPAEPSPAEEEPRVGASPLGKEHALRVHFSPGEACLGEILDCLRDAERTIDICVFTITDDRIARAIVEAHRRKVRVRIITDNDKANDEGSDIWNLERAGIDVRVDRSEFHMHHKFATFDGHSTLTGSYNWTRGAARNNEENLIVSSDPRLVGAFSKEFEALWKHLGD